MVLRASSLSLEGIQFRESMVELAVPIDFRCPISLELMKDPVTLSTGQTYDRRSIERWFATGHNTCPSTMQVIDSNDVAPNRTLRRLIRRWCVCHSFDDAVDIPRPRRPSTWDLDGDQLFSSVVLTEATGRQVRQTLREVAMGEERYNGLKKLKSLAMDSEHQHSNRMVIREAGAIPVLTHFAFSPDNLTKDMIETCELALGLLTLLLLPSISHLVEVDTKQLTAVSWFLNRGSLDARVNAAMVLTSLCRDDDEVKLLVGATTGIFEGLVQLLKEEGQCERATDAALTAVLTIIAGLGKNAVRAADAGAVFAVAELLPEAERRGQDRPLTKLLEQLCSCVEGREAVGEHALIVPMLVRIINQREVLAADSAVSCLWTVSQFSQKKCLDEAAGQAGILMIQLWHLCQTDDGRINPETKRRAADLLGQVRDRINKSDVKC